MQKSW